MQILLDINEKIGGFVWGPFMIALMLGTGVYLTVFTGFFQLTHFKMIMKNTVLGIFGKREKRRGSNITPFQAVSTALAGTIGTGNIAGVATAIVAGGPGAVFWMWVGGLFGMMTKFAEVVLAVHFRTTDRSGEYHGGPMYYIERGLHMKWLAVIFSVLCVLASFGIGNIAQSNSISDALFASFHVPTPLCGLIVAVVCGFVLIGGVRRIARVTEFVVPFMALFYMAGSAIFLAVNFHLVPGAFALILQGAFAPESIAGGAAGYSVRQAVHFGVARGIFTNEAGLGSAPIAHAVSDCGHPVRQGMWGIFEVFFDTIVICTMTTLVILTAGGGSVWQSGQDGAALTAMAFQTVFGTYGSSFLAVAVVFFAVASILGWAFYGQRAIEYLTGGNRRVLLCYRLVFIVMIYVGAIVNLEAAWSLSDTFNGLMAVPNIVAVAALSPVVFRLTRSYLK